MTIELTGISNIKVIYHGMECPDGFGSAWAAWKYFSTLPQVLSGDLNVDYIAGAHGVAPEIDKGALIYLVDFSYRREVIKGLLEDAHKIVILDHHVSARDDLIGLDKEYDNLIMHFDLDRSGAVITWQYFHDLPVPSILQYVQDRDLWHFALPNSKDVTAAMVSYPFEFARWSLWDENEESIDLLAAEGKTINRYRQQLINFYKTRVVIGEIAGYKVPVVNCPIAINSELLNDLAEGYPFAAGYNDKGTKRGWSLRSRPDGEDVSKIAFQFGGGGHPRAAGFATTLDQSLMVVTPGD